MGRNFNKLQQGFTLLELMITIAIGGILLAVGVPSMRDMMVNNRVSSYTNEFVTSLNLARSEAIKRGTRVTACRSSNGAPCAGTGSWQQGWVIFEDDDDDGLFDPATDVIQIHEPLATSVTLIGGVDTGSYISFIEGGSAQKTDGTAQAGDITLSMDGKIRTITLTSVGRVSVSY